MAAPIVIVKDTVTQDLSVGSLSLSITPVKDFFLSHVMLKVSDASNIDEMVKLEYVSTDGVAFNTILLMESFNGRLDLVLAPSRELYFPANETLELTVTNENRQGIVSATIVTAEYQ